MRSGLVTRFMAALSLLAAIAAYDAANAQTVRWPSDTAKAKPLPRLPDPPATLERPTSVVEKTTTFANTSTKKNCSGGKVCVVCVAACDGNAPTVVHEQTKTATGARTISSTTDSDGVADDAPRFAREAWAGIVCGAESGCRVSGVHAPRRSNSYIGAYGVQSNSVYFD